MPVLGVRVGLGASRGPMADIKGIGGIEGNIWKIRTVYCKVLLKTHDGLLNTADNRTWAQINGTQLSTILGHHMPLPGRYCRGIEGDGVWVHLTKHQPDPQADDMSCWPAVVPLLTTRCLYWSEGGVSRGPTGYRGHWGLHMKKLRWSIAKYSWKLKIVYWRQ